MLSPSLMEKVSYVGTLLKSFRQGDVAIEKLLDTIQAVTYVYAAAMAGRTEKNGTLIYHQWVSWLWSGEV